MSEERVVRALTALLAEANGEKIDAKARKDADWYLTQVCIDRLEQSTQAMTKARYCQLAGIHPQTLTNHVARLQLPVDRTVNLGAILHRHHEIHSRGGQGRAVTEESPQAIKQGLEIEALRKKNELMDLQLRAQKGDYIERAQLKLKLEWLVGRLRAIGATLGKRFGADAQKLLNHGLENIEEDLVANDVDRSRPEPTE